LKVDRVAKLIASALAVCLVFGLLLFSLRVSQLISFANKKDVGVELIESLRSRRPDEVATQTWDNALTWTKTAYSNVFFSCDGGSSAAIAGFNSEAKAKFATNVDLRTFDWVWDRLACASPYGEEYVGKFKQDYLESTERNPEQSKRTETEPSTGESEK